MNFFAALTCTIFAWGLAEGHKVFLRNFQSAGVIFHRTRRTHSNDRFGTNVRGCSCLRCTNKTDDILQGVQLSQLHQQSRRHSCTRLVHFLLWQAAKPSGDKCTPWTRPRIRFNPINPLLNPRTQKSVKSVGEHRCLRYVNNGLSGLNGFTCCVIIGLNGFVGGVQNSLNCIFYTQHYCQS